MKSWKASLIQLLNIAGTVGMADVAAKYSCVFDLFPSQYERNFIRNPSIYLARHQESFELLSKESLSGLIWMRQTYCSCVF